MSLSNGKAASSDKRTLTKYLRRRASSAPALRVAITLTCALAASAQENSNEATSTLQPELNEKSFFIDRSATATINLGQTVTLLDEDYPSSETVEIFEIELRDNDKTKLPDSIALVRFLPTRPGIASLPPVRFQASEDTIIETEIINFSVSEPRRSSRMSLSITPESDTIYVGQALRLELVFESSIPSAKFKQLKLNPSFFNDSKIEVIVPRTTAPEDIQVGIPVGGRRVIAERRLFADKKAMGRISLPIYLRFAEPGTYTLDETRIETALLQNPSSAFAPYAAAYFNNGFFEYVDSSQAYERAYTTAPSIEIEVLALPDVPERDTFTGLFQPLKIDVSASPTKLSLGQLIQLDIQVSGEAPHGMIELPSLREQNQLRERFYLESSYDRLWQPDGTLFRTRIRPLTTAMLAIPSIELQTFNPQTGQFEILRTAPVPLEVSPVDGQNFIPINTFADGTVALTNQPEGIWHNLEANPMNDLINKLSLLLANYFWLFLLLAPAVFFATLPLIREARRRSLNPTYSKHRQAYRKLMRATGDSSEKWTSFIEFIATTFESKASAWTANDSEKALKKLGAESEDIEAVKKMHLKADAKTFGSKEANPDFKMLQPIAQRITRLAGKSLFLVCILNSFVSQGTEAATWDEAEAHFAEAMSLPSGSQEAKLRYKEAAFKFEALAKANDSASEAWINAGNAWFQASATGRAIAAYRQATELRPFDDNLTESLATARGMALNTVPDERKWLEKLPLRWLQITTLVANLALWSSLIVLFRYRTRSSKLLTAACALCFIVAFSLLTTKWLDQKPQGVVIVDSTYAKKGPGYAYANAFSETLHDGLEFTLIETRGDWLLIELSDSRQCWISEESVQLLQ